MYKVRLKQLQSKLQRPESMNLYRMIMKGTSRRQLIEATNNNNGFAIALLGTCLINSQEDVEGGVKMIMFAADAKNVLWAKQLKLYLRSFNPWEFPIHHHALLDSDAREQLEIYVAENDYWAMTILGDLLYQGKVIPQDRETAEELLSRAASLGCLYAKELVGAYGISPTKAIASKILDKFKNKNNPKYWMLK